MKTVSTSTALMPLRRKINDRRVCKACTRGIKRRCDVEA